MLIILKLTQKKRAKYQISLRISLSISILLQFFDNVINLDNSRWISIDEISMLQNHTLMIANGIKSYL